MKQHFSVEQAQSSTFEEEMRAMAQETEHDLEHVEGLLAFWTTLLEKLDAEKHDDEASDVAYHALRNYLLMNISDMAEVMEELIRHARLIAHQGN